MVSILRSFTPTCPINQIHHHGNVFLMMWFIRFQRLFEIQMVITQLLNDEMVINSSNIDGISVMFSPSGHNDGIMRTGEGSENASLGGKWCLFSDPSPLRANQPNLQNGNVILMMWFIHFHRSLSKSGW